MEGDEGAYTCNATILEISGSSSYTLPSLISKLGLFFIYNTSFHQQNNMLPDFGTQYKLSHLVFQEIPISNSETMCCARL